LVWLVNSPPGHIMSISLVLGGYYFFDLQFVPPVPPPMPGWESDRHFLPGFVMLSCVTNEFRSRVVRKEWGPGV